MPSMLGITSSGILNNFTVDYLAVSGGNADTIQFHYLLMADTTAMTSSTVIPTAGRFDANQGAAGSATTNFGLYATRRDFDYKGRGF